MKIKCGGGGVDKDGKAYTLREEEREVPDTWFADLFQAISGIKAIPRKCFYVNRALLSSLRKQSRERANK